MKHLKICTLIASMLMPVCLNGAQSAPMKIVVDPIAIDINFNTQSVALPVVAAVSSIVGLLMIKHAAEDTTKTENQRQLVGACGSLLLVGSLYGLYKLYLTA